MSSSCAVLTLATGPRLYLRLAVNLARSFKWWHEDSSIRFAIATDQPGALPDDLEDIETIELAPGEFGDGFSPKLYLNQIAPAERTLFVDADCLCTGRLDGIFDRFEGHAVSVVGRPMSEGEWFGDVVEVCEQFDIPALPRFNGGLYYLEAGPKRDEVYETAQRLESSYDEIGFKRLREQPNEEVLMAVSMALHDQEPVSDDGSMMNTTLEAPGGTTLDVLRGWSKMLNPSDHPDHFGWVRHTEMHPTLVHFLGHQTTQHPYRREEIRLECAVANDWPVVAADTWAALRFSGPWLAKEHLKDLLRPAYHAFFGPRPIRKSADSRH